MDKDLILSFQQQQMSELLWINGEQAKAIGFLQARVNELEKNQKGNSSNSSKPHSSDMGKPKQTQSLRSSSGKKPGGQAGHSGESLSISSTPDKIITHAVSICACCGKNISGAASQDFERRQVYDIHPIEMVVTEHLNEIMCCPRCNTVNKPVFPAGVNHPEQYGTGVQMWAAYFTQFQLLPYARIAQLFSELVGYSVSATLLVNNNRRFGELLQPFIKKLQIPKHTNNLQ